MENELSMKAIHYACFKLEEKATRSVKNKKKVLSMLTCQFHFVRNFLVV